MAAKTLFGIHFAIDARWPKFAIIFGAEKLLQPYTHFRLPLSVYFQTYAYNFGRNGQDIFVQSRAVLPYQFYQAH